jgi:hypothetical protein
MVPLSLADVPCETELLGLNPGSTPGVASNLRPGRSLRVGGADEAHDVAAMVEDAQDPDVVV